MSRARIYLWDLPIRLFHWLLVGLFIASFITGRFGGNAMTWHGRCGLAIVGLLAFRLVWGVVGSTYARFSNFFPTPAKIVAYLRGHWRGVGHNPLGSLSVFGLLGLLTLQVASGLPANDDIAFQGPLYNLVGKDWSDRLTGLHKLSINVLAVLVLLHLAAITFYVRVKKDSLILPMLTGWKDVDSDAGGSTQGGQPLALFVAIVIAVLAVYGASGLWLPTTVAPMAAPPPPW